MGLMGRLARFSGFRPEAVWPGARPGGCDEAARLLPMPFACAVHRRVSGLAGVLVPQMVDLGLTGRADARSRQNAITSTPGTAQGRMAAWVGGHAISGQAIATPRW